MKSIQILILIHSSDPSIRKTNFLIIKTAKVLIPEGQDTPTLISQFLTYPDVAVMLWLAAWNVSRNMISAGTE